MKMRGVLVSLAALWIVVSTACAQVPTVPKFINYQGRLLDTEGVPRVGTFYITFSLQEPDGSVVWTETHEVDIAVEHSGLFSVLLGSSEPLELSDFPIDNDGDFGDILRYLQVSIAEDAESDPIPLTPRKEFVSVAYAFRASDADTLDGLHSVEITGEGWDEVTTLKTLEEHLLAGGNPHDHGGLDGLDDDDHLQYHNDERGDIRYGGDGWDHDIQLVDAQNHIANDHNMGEEAPQYLADVAYVESDARGEPTLDEIKDLAENLTEWGHSTLVENLNANYLQGYTAEQLINEAKKKDEVDPQVAEDLLNNYVPRWDDDLPNGQNDDVGMLVTSIIYVDPGADDTGVADDLVGIGTQNPAGKLEVQDLQDVALVVDSGSDKEAVVQLRENDSPMWTIGNDGDDGDKLKMSTSADLNEPRLTVVRNGNVGIGTDDPAARLHVVGDNTGSETALIVQNNGVAVDDAAAMIFRHGEDESGKITVIRNADGSADLKIESRAVGGLNQNQLYLKSDGKVGIGTDDPEQALEVNGNIKLTGDGGIYRVDGRLELQTTEDNDIAIMPDGDGNVGVGTETPGRMLHVDGEVQGDRFFGSADNENFLDLDDGDDALLSAKRHVIVTADADSDDEGSISLQTKDISRVYVRNDGKVGVGNTSPDYKLDVSGTINARAQVALRASSNNAVEYSSSLFSWGKGGTKNYFEDPVGIGTTTPDAPLDIEGSEPKLRITSTRTGTSWDIEARNPTAILSFKENGTDRMTLKTGGNVGIGTNNPSYKLEVNGNVAATHRLTLRQQGFDVLSANRQVDITHDGDLLKFRMGGGGGGVPIHLCMFDSPGLCLSSGRDVGIKTGDPKTDLHIVDSNSCAGVEINGMGGNGYNNVPTSYVLAHADYRGGAYRAAGYYARDDHGARSWFMGIPYALGGDFFSIGYEDSTCSGGWWEAGRGDAGFPRLTIRSNGNVGIGVTYPDYRLDLNGHMRIHTPYSIYDENARNHICLDNGSEGMNIACDGRLLINADYNSSGSGDIYLTTKGQLGVYVKNNGHVGIKTADPLHALDVNGDALVRGVLRLEGGDYRVQTKNLPPPFAGHLPMLALYALQPDGLYDSVLVPAIGGFTVTDNINKKANMNVRNDGYVEVAQYVIEHSDSRTKLSQRPLSYGLAAILALEPKFYHPADWTTDDNGYIEITGESSVDDIGLVAQEVYEVIPEAVQAPEDESRQLWYMSYSKITTVLVKAVQEQQAEIENLENTVQELTRRIEALEQSR